MNSLLSTSLYSFKDTLVRSLPAFLLALLLFFNSSWAQAMDFAQSLAVKFQCSTRDCDSKAVPPALQMALVECQTKVQSQQCQDFVKNEPEFSGSLRKCDVNNFCKDELPDVVDWWKSCGQGFLEGTGHNIMQLKEMAEGWWGSLKQNAQDRNRFISACNQSLSCKKSLAVDIHSLQNASDEEIAKWSAAALYVEAESQRSQRSSMERSRQYMSAGKSLSERAAEMERRAAEAENNPRPPRSDQQGLLSAAWDWIVTKEANVQCLDANTRAEMRCWGATYIIDPALVGGAALKGAKGANYIMKLAREGRGAATLAGRGTASAVAGAAGEGNAALVRQAVADIKAGKTPAEVRASVGQISDSVDNGQARLELAANVMGRSGVDKLSDAERTWILAGHNTHADTAYGSIGAQKVRDKVNAGGGRPTTVSAADTRKLFEYGVLGSASKELHTAASLTSYARQATDSMGVRILGKRNNNFADTENRLAGERLLRYSEDRNLQAIIPNQTQAKELALGFFEKDYAANVANLNRLRNPSWQDYNRLSEAAIRTGRISEARRYLDLELKAMSRDSYQNVSYTLPERLGIEARNHSRSPQWMKDQVRQTLETIIEESKGAIPTPHLNELQRNIRDHLR